MKTILPLDTVLSKYDLVEFCIEVNRYTKQFSNTTHKIRLIKIYNIHVVRYVITTTLIIILLEASASQLYCASSAIRHERSMAFCPVVFWLYMASYPLHSNFFWKKKSWPKMCAFIKASIIKNILKTAEIGAHVCLMYATKTPMINLLYSIEYISENTVIIIWCY